MSSGGRSVGVALGIGIAVAIGCFLVVSGFFTHWDGMVISRRPPPPDLDDPPPLTRVLVVEGSARRELDWPTDVADALKLPVDPFATPADPALGPRTTKPRLSLSFTVEGVPDPVGTPTPMGVGIAVLAGLLAVAARNAWVGAAPWVFVPREPTRLAPMPKSGAPAPMAQASRSQPGPPPSRPRAGRGRR
jgi:hypothetical protein